MRRSSSWPLPVRLRGVLRSPRATFDRLAAAPRWADALAIAFLAAATTTALVLETEVGQLALLDHLERTATALGPPIDDARYAALREISANGTAYAVVTSLISGPVLAVGLSAVLVGVLRPPAGGRVTYHQVLAVVSHAGVILALRQVIAAPLTYARETLASPLTLSMFFTLLDEASPLSRFAGMVDLFVIWWIVVLAVGVSVLYRRPVARVAVTFAGVYLVLAALMALAAAMTGGSA
ncbi:MAG: YIP1 family protein [Acidobacteria bacterium]|nr:YIP1 family protein [Acidobacteriota bacterium]